MYSVLRFLLSRECRDLWRDTIILSQGGQERGGRAPTGGRGLILNLANALC